MSERERFTGTLENPRVDSFVELGGDRDDAAAGNGCEIDEREVTTEQTGEPQHLVAVGGEHSEPANNGFAQFLGKVFDVGVDETIRDVQDAIVIETSCELNDKQRVTGGRVQPLTEFAARWGSVLRTDERGQRRGIEPPQANFSARVAIEPVEELIQEGWTRCRAHRGKEAHGKRFGVTNQRNETAQAQLIGPMQVLGNNNEWLRALRVRRSLRPTPRSRPRHPPGGLAPMRRDRCRDRSRS